MGAKRRQRGSAAGARQGIAERIADLLGDPEARWLGGLPQARQSGAAGSLSRTPEAEDCRSAMHPTLRFAASYVLASHFLSNTRFQLNY